MSITTINPSTSDIIKQYNELSLQEIDEQLNLSHSAFKKWRSVSFKERTDLMLRAADILLKNNIIYAEQMALEMGKPISQGIAEANKCAWVCRYYAENAEKQLRDEPIKTEMSKSYASFLPIGSVLAIMPWNFPFWQVFRFSVPAIMAGNTVLLKHAPRTLGCSEMIHDIFIEAGFPEGVFISLKIGVEPVPDIIRHSTVAAVTFTGSTSVGSLIGELTGKAIKKSVLELGGSDPYIILEDAPLEKTVDSCVTARFLNSGQSCIAAKRFIVVKSILKDFQDLFVERIKALKVGNPFSQDVYIGPLARKDLQLNLHRQVEDSIEKGAECIIGGKLPDSPGFYYPTTVLSEVKKGMAAYDEETFGPVAAIISVNDEVEAIKVANDTSFGLGAAIFTNNTERGEYIARNELQAGACFVNDFVKSDPRLPFGGTKQSGYGRELSAYGIKEFVNIKTIGVA